MDTAQFKMAWRKGRLSRLPAPFTRPRLSSQKGFALVQLLTLLPLILTVILSVALGMQVLKRITQLQAICIQDVSQLQKDLIPPLKELMKMNKEAQSLRQRREIADRNLMNAMASGVPYAILVAKAAQTAVIAQQIVFRARQEAIRLSAERIAAQGNVRFRQHMASDGSSRVMTNSFYHHALAVEPRPKFSLSPDYVKVFNFRFHQQRLFAFESSLLKGWLGFTDKFFPIRQKFRCAVTLKGDNIQWDLDVLAARPPRS